MPPYLIFHPTAKIFRLWILSFLMITFIYDGYAQKISPNSPSKILHGIKKLKTLKSALYIAAHPDDENNRLIAYLANEELADIGYLSLTRGDGGQNLIGQEIREELGILRTQELLAARKLDGGKQYFATANDFGFSKNPEETFTIWDKEKLLADVVWIIRKLQPDILITRFSHLPAKTHGHHTASAILAFEAFDAAGDPKRFPEQLQFVDVWQPKRLLWNSGPDFYADTKGFENKPRITINTGKYNPLLGKSYGEIAAESRSEHKCQGMGTKATRGDRNEYFILTKGETIPDNDLFYGVQNNWNRVKGGKHINGLINEVIHKFQLENPSASVPLLVNILNEIEKLPDSHWKRDKIEETKKIIAQSLGLFLEANAEDFTISPNERIRINIEAVNRSGIAVDIKNIHLKSVHLDTLLNVPLKNAVSYSFALDATLDENTFSTQPYWLNEKSTLGQFTVHDQHKIGLPENEPALLVGVNLNVYGKEIAYTIPVNYRYTHPISGDVYRPIAIIPPVFLDLTQKVYLFPNSESKKIQVKVKAGKRNTEGRIHLNLGSDWQVKPTAIAFKLANKNEEQVVEFTVIPPVTASETEITASAVVNDKTYASGYKTVQYEHIPAQIFFPQATAKGVRINLNREGDRIAYYAGAGDKIAESLQQAGYQVNFLKDEQFTLENLTQYEALVVGVRAYNVQERLPFYKEVLNKYVENGGNVIVQYNTDFDLKDTNFPLFPLEISGDSRVTDEHAPVRILKPEHAVFNYPNKINEQDFQNWVQERGAYFPIQWSDRYEAVLSVNDKGEQPLDGSLLIAKYGKGNYIYTSLAWFRQLPAGVPGAYRLFANIIGLGRFSSKIGLVDTNK